jgi:undecaprenyl phosphate N,N'-diacetylbacillosamine 1-phosphate transferase
MYKNFFKFIIDWLAASIAIVLLFPLFLIVSLFIKLDSKGGVFFKQQRLGKDGKLFIIYKFRSMRETNVKKADKKLFENDPRITTVGKFIRKTSIDELPQLINILKGDMSFIGPRPPVPHYPKKYEDYNEFERRRFNVKPGISGLAQIRCREVHDWDINIPIDVEYVEKYGFLFDFKLFIASLSAFFKTDNVYRKN